MDLPSVAMVIRSATLIQRNHEVKTEMGTRLGGTELVLNECERQKESKQIVQMEKQDTVLFAAIAWNYLYPQVHGKYSRV